MIDEDTDDRAEIHDLFSRYADAVTGRQWELLDEVFTEDVTSTAQWSTEIAGRTAVVGRIRDVIERAAKGERIAAFREKPQAAESAPGRPGEVLASGTAYGTVVGSGLEFAFRGSHELRGVPGTWPLFALASP